MELISHGEIVNKIHIIRNAQIMLDRDLAELYDVETKYLKRQVRRNLERFPIDFMFELTKDELHDLRCQIGSSSHGGTRYLPMAFTEQGVAQLSSVLNSQRAIKVNIQIIRLFTRMRKLLMGQKDLVLKVHKIEEHLGNQSAEIRILFEYIKKLNQKNTVAEKQKSRKKIGYK